ncbi:MAG: RNA methyltransferase [Hormoscilla sp. GUM202]|nr:RNA methyltransferase [Hormoscilla sp. GUM202]
MLTSRKNPLVKQLRKLHHPQGRREQQLFLLEGTHLLEVACAVDYPLVTVCCTTDWLAGHGPLWENACRRCQRTELVSPEVMQAIATTVHPDGVVAAAQPRSQSGVLPTRLGLALETVQDPGNLGTMMRTAVAAGAEGLWLSADSVDIHHPKLLRASAGEWFRLPVAVSPDLKDLVYRCQQQGIQVVATSPLADNIYWEIDLSCPTLILLGNEGAGLSPDLASLADRHVKIPLANGVESLNVAIAAALVLYEAQRQGLTISNSVTENNHGI